MKVSGNHCHQIYVIPEFSNPSGTVLSERRRRHLIDLAQRNNLLLLTDDVYRFVNFGLQLPPPVVELAKGTGVCISASSMTKILCPGVRVGWLEGDSPLLRRLSTSGLVTSGGAPNHLCSGVVTHLMESLELDAITSKLVTTYSRRAAKLRHALGQTLPHGCAISPANGVRWACLCSV